jgi:hypothetical protein
MDEQKMNWQAAAGAEHAPPTSGGNRKLSLAGPAKGAVIFHGAISFASWGRKRKCILAQETGVGNHPGLLLDAYSPDNQLETPMRGRGLALNR